MADNTNSQASLKLPTIPSNFDSLAGSTKRDFVVALFDLLKTAQIQGVNSEDPNPYDLTTLQATVEGQQKDIDILKGRTPRFIVVSGVSNSTLPIPFQDLGTDNYDVAVTFTRSSGDPPTITWYVVAGSKTSSQVTIYLDGDATGYQLEVTITPLTNI